MAATTNAQILEKAQRCSRNVAVIEKHTLDRYNTITLLIGKQRNVTLGRSIGINGATTDVIISSTVVHCRRRIQSRPMYKMRWGVGNCEARTTGVI